MRKFLAVALLAAASLLLNSGVSKASLIIQLSFDGGAFTTVVTGADFTTASFTGTFGNTGVGDLTDAVSITLQGTSSTNGSLPPAGTYSDLLSSNTRVVNLGTVTHTLSIRVFQDNYTLPAGSPVLVTSIQREFSIMAPSV